ncbi:MAG: Ig-like domain-containing protein [Reinekea sp.]
MERNASIENLGARGFSLVRNQLQVAAGKGGIKAIEFTEINVLAVTPADGTDQVSVTLEPIVIELSDPVHLSQSAQDYVRVTEGDLLYGADVSNWFDIQFRITSENVELRNVIELTLKPDVELKPNQKYIISVLEGLQPQAGDALSAQVNNYFITADSILNAPQIMSICARQRFESDGFCSASGGIEGGTEIIVTGYDFSDNPGLMLGGQTLVIDRLTDLGDGSQQIYAKTVPNYAGPASVRVYNTDGVYDEVIGGFTYVDQLQIDFIQPAVVSAAQLGVNDQLTVIGLGFQPDLHLKAWKHGQPDTVQEFAVDGDHLTLYSAEQMAWVAPTFSDGTNGYRGFVDVEVVDGHGRSYIKPKALFYGRLAVNRVLQTEVVRTDALEELNPVRLPPGAIVDIAADDDMDLLYVLGRPENRWSEKPIPSPGRVTDLSQIRDMYYPGWISLVHYNRNDIANAAPMHRLGYYDLPKDTRPSAFALGEQALYVFSRGYDFKYIDTVHDNRTWLHVLNRIDTLNEEDSTDRTILFEVPLPTDKEIESARGDYLFVVNKPETGAAQLVFDLSRPGLPLVSVRSGSRSAVKSVSPEASDLVIQATGTDRMISQQWLPTEFLVEQGQYNSNGFEIPGTSVQLDATSSVAVRLDQSGVWKSFEDFENLTYVSLVDFSDPTQPTLLDAVTLGNPVELFNPVGKSAPTPLLLTDDGLIVSADYFAIGQMRLTFIDTLLADITNVSPAVNASGVSTDAIIKVRFSADVPVSEDQLSTYINVIRVDGSEQGEQQNFTASFAGDDQRNIEIAVTDGLSANSEYRVELSSVAGSRRIEPL